MIAIYELIDPITDQTRYIGKTNNITVRYRRHLKDVGGDTHRENWIRSLLNDGAKPLFNVIEYVSDNEWEFWEQYWISQYKTWGFDLTNLTDGGEIGAKYTLEHRKKLSDVHKGQVRTKEMARKTVETKMADPEWENKKSAGFLAVVNKYGRDGLKEIARRVVESRRKNGKPWHSDNTKIKIGLAHKGRKFLPTRKTKAKQVIQIDINGQTVAIHKSLTVASQGINSTPANLHTGMHKNGGLFKGFKWVYK